MFRKKKLDELGSKLWILKIGLRGIRNRVGARAGDIDVEAADVFECPQLVTTTTGLYKEIDALKKEIGELRETRISNAEAICSHCSQICDLQSAMHILSHQHQALLAHLDLEEIKVAEHTEFRKKTKAGK